MTNWLLNGRYRLFSTVSTHPRASVHFAEDRRRPGFWAVKLWRGSRTPGTPAIPLAATHDLRHPHLAPLSDFGRVQSLRVEDSPARAPSGDVEIPGTHLPPTIRVQEEDPVFTVSPWFGGGDIRAGVARLFSEGDPDAETLDRWLGGIAGQALSALRFLHEHSLLHFDVSPGNILLDGSELAPGIPRAILIDLELSDRDSTPLGTRVRGTFPCIAPEVLQDSMVDPRADLFSLGATLYHALDRSRLLDELGRERASSAATEGRLPPLRSRIPSLSERWGARIDALLAVDPSDRPTSAAELLEDLAAAGELPPGVHRQQPITWSPPRPVGLEKEFDYLLREVEKLRLGESRSALILTGGTSGIGRGTVARRLEERARLEGIRTVTVRCAGALEAPLAPIAELLSQLHHDPPSERPPVDGEREGATNRHPDANNRAELAELIQWLHADEGSSDRFPPLTRVSEERARLFGRIGTALERFGDPRGTLIILEDVQRAAPELLEILGVISHRLRSDRAAAPDEALAEASTNGEADAPRILFLCTVDDEEASAATARGLASLAQHPHVSRIALKPHNPTRARHVIQNTLGRSHLPAPVIDTLHTISNGLTRPILAWLRESERQGKLRQERAGWTWIGEPDGMLEVPAERARRFASLPVEDRTMLRTVELARGPLDRALALAAAKDLGASEPYERLLALEAGGWIETLEGHGEKPAIIPTLALPPRTAAESEEPDDSRLATALGRALLDRTPDDPTPAAWMFLRGRAWEALAGVIPDTLAALANRICPTSLVEFIDAIELHAPEGTLPQEAMRMRIEALRDTQREEEALERADAWIARWEDVAEVPLETRALRGELLNRLERLPAAHQELEDAIDLITSDTPAETRARLRVELSEVLRGEGMTDRAHTLALLAVEDVTSDGPIPPDSLVPEILARVELARTQVARGWNERAAEWLAAFLEERGDEIPISWVGYIHHYIADIELNRGRYDSALSHWRQCLPIQRRTANYSRLATVIVALGRLAYTRGDRKRATRLHRLSLKLHEQIGDRRGLAQVLNNIGLLYKMQNKLEAAEACFLRCQEILEELGPANDLAALLGNLSDVMMQKGNFRLALEHALASLDLRKPLGQRRGIAFAYYRIALIYRNQGELDRAADFGEKSLELRRDLGDKHNLLYSQKLLGDIASTRARYYEANRSLRQSLALAESLGNPAGRCSLLASLAQLEVRMGRIDEAIAHAVDGTEIATEEGLATVISSNQHVLGLAHLEAGDLSSAEQALSRAEEICRRERSARDLAQVLLSRVELALELGNLERGWPTLEEAHGTIEEIGLADLLPTYYRLRGGLTSTGPRADISVARRLLERGLEEATDLELPEEVWRLRRDLARLEDEAGNPDAALEHLQLGAEQLQSIHDQLPAEFQSTYLESGARLEFLSEWRSRKIEPAPPPSPAAEEERARPRPRPGDGPPAAEDLLRLQEVTLLLNSEHDVQVLLDRILEEVLSLFGAERGFLILVEGDSRKIRAARDIDEEEISSPDGKFSHSIAQEVAETKKIFLTNDAQHDRRLRESHSVHDLKLQAIACFPLLWRGDLLGVIYIENRFRKQIVPKERLRLLEAFGAQASQAIANARLHDELVRHSRELERSAVEIEDLNARLRDRVIEQDRELAEARRTLAEQQEQLEERYRFHNMIGSSERMREVFRVLDRIAGTQLPVLIEGESGTGKELAARALHYNSSRRKEPFVSENCGAISESLFESELFGHVKGAFTGADRNHTGLFAAADGGTIFLDEVHQLSLGSQRKLLRVLQEGEYRPVGAKEFLRTDVRVLAASNESLYRLVTEGKFREDLYYRLNVLRVELPPLRQRGQDVLILAQHFLEEVVSSQELGEREFSAEALRALAQYSFPGNVRELKNVVEKAAILGRTSRIDDHDLFFDTAGGPAEGNGVLDLPSSLTALPLKEAREEFQKQYVERILAANAGVVSHAATRAGVTRESLHRMIRKYALRDGKGT